MQGAPASLALSVLPKALLTINVENNFTYHRMHGVPTAYQYKVRRSKVALEQFKKSRGRAGYQYITSLNQRHKGHYTPLKHMKGVKIAPRVFFRSKQQINQSTKKAKAKRRRQLTVLRQAAQLFKPVKVKRVTDSSRHTVGSMPQLIAYPLNPSATDDGGGYMSSIHCEKGRTSTSNGAKKGAGVVTKVLLRAGDIALIKAARGEGEFYYLAELM
jgi:hypothetical protein